MKLSRSIIAPVLGLAVALAVAATIPFWGGRRAPLKRQIFAMDTVFELTLWGAGQDDMDAAVAFAGSDGRFFSRQNPDSPVAALNRAAGHGPVQVPERLASLMTRALGWTKRTNGAFNPMIGPIVDLWGIGTDKAHVPFPREIREALPRCRWQDVKIDGRSVELSQGQVLDLGGIAKGTCADDLRQMLQSRGVSAGVLNLGGNVVAFGRRPEGGAWQIGVQDPLDERGAIFGIVSLPDGGSVVTSGPYERYFFQNGRRYHHLFDPATGRPAESDLQAVTVVSERSEDGDALATALFVLGSVKGEELLKSLPGIDAIFVGLGWVKVTPGLKGRFELTDEAPYEIR